MQTQTLLKKYWLRNLLFFPLYAIFLVMVGCVKAPTTMEVNNADYGTYPTNYEEVIKAYLGNVLKDPYSAKVEFVKGPSTGWYAQFNGSKFFGYRVCAEINAKNSYGAYSGKNTHYFMINNERVILHFGGGDEQVQASSGCYKNW